MLYLKTVEPEQYKRYKSEDFVPAGTYYVASGRFSDVQKKQLSPIACSSKTGAFCWLLPAERWIKVLADGFTPPERNLYGRVRPTPGSLAHLRDVYGLRAEVLEQQRKWQTTALMDAVHSLETTNFYRRGYVAPLGAGKTLHGLALTQLGDNPLVVAPKYLHDEWRTEARKWGFDEPEVTTYQSAHKHKNHDVIVCDEILCAKNPETKNHANVVGIAETAKVVVGLTGSPSSVTPMDLRWLRAIYPGCVPLSEKSWRFLFGLDTELKEIAPGRSVYVTKTWDQEKISNFTAPYLLTVNIAEIQDELPEVQYKRIVVPRCQHFDALKKGAATEAGSSKALSQARMCSDGFITDDLKNVVDLDSNKLDALAEFVESTDEPIIIAAAWTESVSKICDRFKDLYPARLDGETSGDYGGEVDRFRAGETRLLVLNARIAEGLNLQANCRLLVFYSNCAYPIKRKQLIGRIVRPGQTRGVIVTDLVSENTLDDATIKVLNNHSDQSEAFVLEALRAELRK